MWVACAKRLLFVAGSSCVPVVQSVGGTREAGGMAVAIAVDVADGVACDAGRRLCIAERERERREERRERDMVCVCVCVCVCERERESVCVRKRELV